MAGPCLAADERARDESESILDEASFQHSIAQRFQRTGGSKDADTGLESAFVRYFDLLAPRGVKVVPDPDFPNAILQLFLLVLQEYSITNQNKDKSKPGSPKPDTQLIAVKTGAWLARACGQIGSYWP